MSGREEEKKKKNGRSGTATSFFFFSLLLPPFSFFFSYPRASNAICTANGLMIRRCQAKGRTKSAPGCLGLRAHSGEAILGDAAATPKMAGLAHKVRHIVVFCWVLLVNGVGQVVGYPCVCVISIGGRGGGGFHSPCSHIWPPLFSPFLSPRIFCSC